MSVLRKLGWWIRDYAYALAWQARALVDRTDPAVYRTGDRTPIVVIPGVYETWQFLRPLIAAIHDRGHPVHVLPVLRHNRSPVDEAAARVAEYLSATSVGPCVLLAHSKGGLVGKRVMLGAGGSDVRGMLAVATPFAGSFYGRFMLAPTLRIFSPRDTTVLALAAEKAVDARIVSIYAQFDPHIPEGSELPGAARNVVLPGGGHFRVLADPRVVGELSVLAG